MNTPVNKYEMHTRDVRECIYVYMYVCLYLYSEIDTTPAEICCGICGDGKKVLPLWTEVA